MKIIRLFFVVLSFFLILAGHAGADPLSMRIISECGFTSDFGNPIMSYEDVDEITNIGPNLVGSGPAIAHHDINAFNVPVKDETGKALLSKISSTDGRVLFDPGFGVFLKLNLYVEAGDMDKGVWKVNSVMSGFPVDYDPKDKPHEKEYFLCLKGGWPKIPPLDFEPDAKSCDVKRSLCDYPPCIKEKKDEDDEDSDGDTNEIIQPEEHHQPTNNVFTDLASQIMGAKTTGGEVSGKSSGITFTMTFRDRTPPRIIGCIDDEFPELGKDKPARTGDWYKIEGLKIVDNDSDKVGTCLCLGKIDAYPDPDWMNNSEWVKEEPFREVEKDDDAQYIIMPNSCHGYMQYSIFAWDKNGLLNPGDPRIIEDKPECCYGLKDPPDGFADLGKGPLTALSWPPDLTLPLTGGGLLSVDPDLINPKHKRGTGLLNIVDNDLPNIVIKFTSVKDGKSTMFPPVIQPLELPIFTSSEYKKGGGVADANAKDYEDFVGGTGAVFTNELVDETASLFFKVLDILPSPVMDPGEVGILDRIKSPASEDDHDFIRKCFRLEDYKESDTDVNGAPIIGNLETFGKRNGIGGEVTAVLENPLQEDVEYLVSVWTDDNVKWATKDESGKVLTTILALPTGINGGEINLNIPNQLPPVSHKMGIDKTQAVSKEMRVVFREPTPPGGSSNVSFYHDRKFPFIEVCATDFAGFTRKIKLFIRVSNENPNIRILERQHEKHD
ncbi:MAG: hypothetical protein AB1403_04955 [Candidatus Riflebacteria bacterium]